MTLRLAALLLFSCLASLQAQASSTWRCNGGLISLGDNASKVISTCGAPVHRALAGYVERRDEYGFIHEKAVEEWTYGPRNGMYYFLRFEANHLTQINSKRKS